MSWNPVARAERRARNQDAAIARITPAMMKGANRSRMRRFLSTRNSAAEQTKPGFVLHPTKGWRPMSVIRSAASVCCDAMKRGQMAFTVPPTQARAVMQKARASA